MPDGQNTGGDNDSGNTGTDNTIITSDANSSLNLANSGNTNSSASTGGTTGGAQVVNSDNGTNSDNSNSATVNTNNDTDQENSAWVVNNASQGAVTGDNNTSFNTGGNNTILTGDANVIGNIFNNLNSNMDGFLYAEFNVVGDHNGDLVLAFDPACLAGCITADGTVITNLSNGAFSTNDNTYNQNTNNSTDQTNDGYLQNNLDILADTGDNNASNNTNGDNTIDTGDANVNANIVNALNNNVSGNIVYSVVNIFGDLVGNIVLPLSVLQSFCGECFGMNTTVSNSDNGAYSTNSNNVDITNTDSTNQFNNATIDNNLVIDANTGSNNNSFGTGGDSTTITGAVDVEANVLNIANNNIEGGDVWLVLVNNAGNWIGQIIGGPIGGLLAMSDGLNVTTGDPDIANSGNGDSSTNSNDVAINNTDSTNQTNTGVIQNNVNITANTGYNSTLFNTGGNSSIFTGDINVVLNVINLLNNNISGSGKLFITVINVFGKWTGDFFGPDQEYSPKVNSNASNGDASSGSGESNQQPIGGVNSIVENSTEDSTSQGTPQVAAYFYPNTNIVTRATGTNQIGSAGDKLADSSLSDVFTSPGANKGNKVLKFNLAWIVMFIVLGGLYFGSGAAKEKLLAKSSVQKK